MAAAKKVSISLEKRENKYYKEDDIINRKVHLNDLDNARDRQIHIMGYDMENKGPKLGARHVQVFLVFLCITIGLGMRSILSLAIVAMTTEQSPNPDIPHYDWKNQSVILSSFFWGYIWLQVVAGYCGKRFGPKYFLVTGFFLNAIAHVCIPVAAQNLGSIGVIMCRIFQGFSQSFMFPSAHTLLGKWAPAEERSTLGTLVYSGITFGGVLTSIITGYVSSSWWGWPTAFYIFGVLAVAWCVLFLVFGHNSPALHPSITPEERRYIEVSLGQHEDTQVLPTPWKSILSCVHLWAVVVASMGNSWGYAMLMTQSPTYLAKVLDFDIKSNGLVNATPYMIGTITGFMFAPLADYLIKHNHLSRVNVRRIFQVFGAAGQAVCLTTLAFAEQTKVSAVVLLALGNTAYSSTLVGYAVNHVDLSPRFSGILQGISNGMSQLCSIASPLFVQYIVTDQTDVAQWRIVFVVAAAIYLATSIFYAFFASACRQPWDGPFTDATAKLERIKKASVISVPGAY